MPDLPEKMPEMPDPKPIINGIECTQPYPGSKNKPGDVEDLDGTTVTHYFVDVVGMRYHFVEAGERDKPVILMLHGMPECWYAWYYQIRGLSDSYRIIALDIKGYGQSEKRWDGEYSFAHCSYEVAQLIELLDIEQFYLVGHDRGSVMGDWLCAMPGFADRIIKYVRMQQSFNQAHWIPRADHEGMSSQEGTELYLNPIFPAILYTGALETPYCTPSRPISEKCKADGGTGKYKLVSKKIDLGIIHRLNEEFTYPGLAEAVPLTFQGTNFDKEMEDRENYLIPKMTMPVLLLQGEEDEGQPKESYEGLDELDGDFRIHFVKCGHFLHLESPDEVTALIRGFIEGE